MPAFHLNGGVTIAGTFLPPAVIEPVYRRMLDGTFTNADLIEVARDSLRRAGKSVAMSFDLADRVRRNKGRGRCELVSKTTKGTSTYRFTPYDHP